MLTQHYPPTTSEQLLAVRAFFGQIFREELGQLLAAQNAAPVTSPSIPDLGGLDVAREVTGLSKARIYALVSQRGIPHSKRGNRLYFNRAELLAWVAEGKRGENKK
jgi:excisionase family DNA binding protein